MKVPTTTNDQPGETRTGTSIAPLDELGFKIDIQGMPIGRFRECTGLAVEYDVTEYAEGGNNEFVHHLRGRIRYLNVTLRRGLTYEDELLRWFYAAHKLEERPPVTISVLDTLGEPVRHFGLASALPVRWTGPSSTTGSDGAASESLEIAHRGFV